MSNSFGLVEKKTLESDFFLKKLKEAYSNNILFETDCYFSAFVAASRSITLTLQYSLKDLNGFEPWYSDKKIILQNNRIAKFFIEFRNKSIHQGKNFAFSLEHDEFDADDTKLKSWFQNSKTINLFESIINQDILSASEEYFCLILKIIQDCYVVFGKIIDPDQFWTTENLKNNNLSCEDIEKMLGFPRGWTKVSGQTEKERENGLLKYIRSSNQIDCPLERLFMQYLKIDKYGNSVK